MEIKMYLTLNEICVYSCSFVVVYNTMRLHSSFDYMVFNHE